MILHVYHCSLALVEDRTQHSKSSRPTAYSEPSAPGESDFCFKPNATDLMDRDLGRIAAEFQSLGMDQLLDGSASAVSINYDYLSRKLQIPVATLKNRLRKLREMRIIPGLAIDYDYEKWMQHSFVKGCIVVMAFVEAQDYQRDHEELARSFAHAILTVRISLLDQHGKYQLNRICIVPNAHLSDPDKLGPDPAQNLAILGRCRQELISHQLRVDLASYGYAKNLDLVLHHYHIHGHKVGYLYRVV